MSTARKIDTDTSEATQEQAFPWEAIHDYVRACGGDPYSLSSPRPAEALKEALKPAEDTQQRENNYRLALVEKDAKRWETGIRNIVSLLGGAREEFEIPQVVETVRKLAHGSDLPEGQAQGETLPWFTFSANALANPESETTTKIGYEQEKAPDGTIPLELKSMEDRLLMSTPRGARYMFQYYPEDATVRIIRGNLNDKGRPIDTVGFNSIWLTRETQDVSESLLAELAVDIMATSPAGAARIARGPSAAALGK